MASRGIDTLPDGAARGFNAEVYANPEIQRIARITFEMAQNRRNSVTSVDNANVLDVGEIWRREVIALHAKAFSKVTRRNLSIDNCA